MAMFNRDDVERGEGAETIIGPSVKVEGNFVGSGNVVVEGVVNGSIKTTKDLRIGNAAKVKADVEAGNIIIAGEIHGNVKANGRLELAATGKIFGNVETAMLTVAQGAILNGKCMMVKVDVLPETHSVERTEKKRGV